MLKKQQLSKDCFDHDHNDKYYTEDEIDNKLDNKADINAPAFTGTVTVSELSVTTKLTIPGGEVWIE